MPAKPDPEKLFDKAEQDRLRGVIGEALKGFSKAEALFAKAKNELWQAHCQHRQGVVEYQLGNMDAARGHYDTALPLFRAVQNRLGEANTLRSLGDLERSLENYEAAEGHYDRAIALYKAIQSNRQAVSTERDREELTQAIAAAKKGLAVVGLGGRIDKAIAALGEDGHRSARDRVKASDAASGALRTYGGLAMAIATLMLFAPLFYWLAHHDWFDTSFGSKPYLAWLIFAFPFIGLSTIGISLLRHDAKIIEDRRAYARQIDLIERLCGLLRAGRVIEEDKDDALIRVRNVFDQVVQRMLAEGLEADAAMKMLTPSHDTKPEEGGDTVPISAVAKLVEAVLKAQKPA